VRLLAVSVLFLAGASQVSAQDPAVIDSLQLGQTTCCSLSGVAVNPDTNRIYVTDPSRDELYVVDGYTHLLLDRISVGRRPWGVAVNPFTNQVFVSSIDDHVIYVIDGVDGRVVDKIEGSEIPVRLAVNYATNRLLTTLPANDCICSIDCATREVRWVAPVDDRPSGVAVDTNEDVVWAVHPTGCFSVIDGGGGSWAQERCPGQSLLDIAVNPVLRKAYATDRAAGSVLVIDTGTLGVVRETSIDGYPRAIAANSLTGRIYVSVSNDTVRVLDGVPEQVISTVSVADIPMDIAVNPLTERVYVVSFGGGALDVIEDRAPLRPPARVLSGYITQLLAEVDTLSGAQERAAHLKRAIGVLQDEDGANDFKAAVYLMDFIDELDPTSKRADNPDARLVAAARRIVAMFVGS
jgi:YVTN family beta-propeller protein